MKIKIEVGQILSNEDVVNLMGNEKQIAAFYKRNKLTEPSKSAVMKKLESVCKYENTKIGRKQAYKIIEVYEQEKEIIDKRKINNKGNNSIFTNDFKNIIIDCIYNNGKISLEEMLISKTALFQLVNLINNNYKIGRKDKEKLAQMLDVPKKTVDDFYDNSYSKLAKTVESGLKSCRSSSILTYESVVAIAVYNPNVSYNELGEPVVLNGSEIKNNIALNYREATKEEKKVILSCEREVKKYLGFDENVNNSALYLSGKWKQYKNLVTKELKDRGTNIKFYYDAYKLTWVEENIKKLYEQHCSLINVISSNKDINDNIIKSFNKTNNTRLKNMEKEKIKRIDNFIEDNNKLINVLINDSAEDIQEDFYKFKKERRK
ncbi:MAG: hypothetical protein J6D47_18615 [Peptostreptococcaceae bacterium]|nr:hypothetical protein [Peptostreptococcaceae bacterium]